MKFRCMDAWHENNSIFYVEEDSGIILRYDLNNTISYCNYVDLKENTIVRRIFKYKSQYYFVTNTGIVKYDSNKEMHGKYIYDINKVNEGIKDAILWNDSIIVIPKNLMDEWICYDIAKEERFPFNDIVVAIKCINSIEKFMISTIKLVEDTLYFTLIDDKKLYSYNIIKKEIKTECEFDEIISAFDFFNNTFWIRYKEGFRIIEWNKEKDTIRKYNLKELSVEERAEEHAKIIVTNNRVILLPSKSNTFAFVDFDNDCITRIGSKTELKHSINHEKYSFTIGNLIIENYIICMPWSTDLTVIINTESLNMEVYQPKIHRKVYEMDMELKIKRKNVVYETREENIHSFVKNLM